MSAPSLRAGSGGAGQHCERATCAFRPGPQLAPAAKDRAAESHPRRLGLRVLAASPEHRYGVGGLPFSSMTDLEQQLGEAVAHLTNLGLGAPVGVVLGSGLGGFADTLDELTRIEAADVPHFPKSTVLGHAGRLCFGRVGGLQVACMQGRVHLYEGFAADRVVFGALLLAMLGCKVVLLTNAAGGIADRLGPGMLMSIRDHINLSGHNPLVGPNTEPYPRFPDLSAAYDPELAQAAERAARECQVSLESGIYACTLGPSYETPAEIRMLRVLGADAVGMSTVPEVIALRHRGVRVGAMSLITNRAAGLERGGLSHAEVIAVAARAGEGFVRVLRRWVMLIAELVGD
jgi:purine-nucleoside phosphorylase